MGDWQDFHDWLDDIWHIVAIPAIMNPSAKKASVPRMIKKIKASQDPAT